MTLRIAILSILAAGLFSAATAPASACACCGTWQVTNVAADDTLNIRAGPNVSYAKVGELPPFTGCIMKTGQCVANWCQIKYIDMTGWVNEKYLRYKN